MLLRRVTQLPEGPGWEYEVNWDSHGAYGQLIEGTWDAASPERSWSFLPVWFSGCVAIPVAGALRHSRLQSELGGVFA